jgi:Domain of unknown function (DUF1905)/Bacteriocin-protection, YdeI or OmpD-Associated
MAHQVACMSSFHQLIAFFTSLAIWRWTACRASRSSVQIASCSTQGQHRPHHAGIGHLTAKTFRSTVVPAGNATGAEVPAEVIGALGEGKRPKVAITINGHTWRSRVASKGGRYLVGISAANRAAAGIDEGDEIEVTLELDTEPRGVDEPADLKVALDAAPTVRTAFERLPFGLRRKHVNDIEAAKSAQTRERRIERLVESLR